jgi:dienelactone hydrolase
VSVRCGPGIIIIALALFVAIGPSRATAQTTTGDELAAAYYDYTPYPPGAPEVVASPVSETPRYRVIRLTFPSRIESPDTNNNLVRGYYYQPKVEGPVPAVIVLHGWGAIVSKHLIQSCCKSFAEQGTAAFMLELPYHLERRAKGKLGGAEFMTADPQQLVEFGRQAVIDLRCVLDWLEVRPEVDPQRLGIVGLSLGAITANLAMGVDDRLKTGVFILGGGDLTGIIWRDPLARPWKTKLQRAGITEARLREALRPVEPLTFADPNRTRRVLMINGYYDLLIPEASTLALRQALGNPPIFWMNSGHFSMAFSWGDISETAYRFLQGEFGEGPPWSGGPIRVRTVKVALLWDEHQGFRPGVFKELLCSKGRGRFSLDLGLTTKGLFLGANGMATDNVTIGLGTPLGKGWRKIELYSGLQLVL